MAKPRSLSQLRQKAWDVFSHYIRLSHADHRGFCACFTCGTQQHWKEMDAGHAIDGRRNAVLLDEELVKPQCRHCNRFLDGNHKRFTARLIKEHGRSWWEQKQQTARQAVKCYRTDIEQIIDLYRLQIDAIEHSHKHINEPILRRPRV